MARTVVGLFNSTSEAQHAIEQLLSAGFQRTNLHLATPDTLRAEHLPAAPDTTRVEPFEEGLVRFFTNLFTGNENADNAQAHIAASHSNSAVITINAATEDEADRARQTLDLNGAIDVYKQATPEAAGPADDVVDLEGSLRRVRDDDELDANGLTTH